MDWFNWENLSEEQEQGDESYQMASSIFNNPLYRQLFQQLKMNLKKNEEQKNHLRDVYHKSQVRHYKQQFKFYQRVRRIFKVRDHPFIDARQIFQFLLKNFADLGFDLCEITIKTYKKDAQSRQKKYEDKLKKVQKQIQKILKRDCYKQNTAQQLELNYRLIPVSLDTPQNIHFTLKIPVGSSQVLQTLQNNTLRLKVVQDFNYRHKDYLSVSNNSCCNSLTSWDIGCRIKSETKQTYYRYFKPGGEKFITFSRPMRREDQSNIRQICIYNSCDANTVIKAVIKKQQIYLLTSSRNKKDIYIFLSSPPIFEIAFIPPNTYCLPNYLNNWERVQNFLLLKHRNFKDNDFLRMFLYSNSYIHIELNDKDQLSCKNINNDIELIQKELNCQYQPMSNLQICQKMPKILQSLNVEDVQQSLSFIYFLKRPLLTSHTRWKLSYQILLLIRFNVMGPGDLDDFLRLVQINQSRLDQILQFLSHRSSGYTNRIAGINRFTSQTYMSLKKKLADYLIDNNERSEEWQKPEYSDQSCSIYKVSITPSGILPDPISNQTKCRLIRQFQDRSDFFLKITVLDDSGESIKNQKYLYQKIIRKQIDDVCIMGKKYAPLGWSQSQLKASSIWYVNEIPTDQQSLKKMTQASILQFLGDFSKIPIPAKKAARIGQAFSSSYCYDSSLFNIRIINDDRSQKNFLFTDGIGKISKDLFEKITKKFKDMNIRMNCCLQIRYKGAKGVLLVNELLQPNTIALRESMVKYECKHPAAQKYLDILSWDKYLPGYLNRQIILLLKSLDISDKVFLDFQRDYIDILNRLSFIEKDKKDKSILKIFNDIDDSEDSFMLTVSNLKGHFNLSTDLFFQQILQNVKDNKFAELKKKSRILIQKSARLIGVIDEYDVLNEDELYCCIKKPVFNESQKEEQNESKEVIRGNVVITRNPSLSPADVRKCKCISEEEIDNRMRRKRYDRNFFSSFANCIVFPKKGSIPLTSQISGSDLDGDIFFICWDQKFIIRQPQPCETIDDPNKKLEPAVYGQAEYKQMLDFFVKFANDQKLGRINNIHLVTADKSEHLANDPRCKRLAAIHGKAVDYAKSGQAPQEIPKELVVREYPDFMQKWNKPIYKSQSVLGQLYRRCKQQIDKRQKNQPKIELHLQRNIIQMKFQCVTQLQIKEVLSLLRRYEYDVTGLIHHSNLKTQFELYTGSSAESDQIRNQFGRKRLADWIIKMRDEHQRRFFGKYHKQYERYRELRSNQLKRQNVFSKDQRVQKQLRQKAIMCYVISYFCYCLKKDKNTHRKYPELRQFFDKVIRLQQGYEGKYLGFVWVVIPKIIINLSLINH